MQNRSTNTSSRTRIRINPGRTYRSGANATSERIATSVQSTKQATTLRPTTFLSRADAGKVTGPLVSDLCRSYAEPSNAFLPSKLPVKNYSARRCDVQAIRRIPAEHERLLPSRKQQFVNNLSQNVAIADYNV